MIDEFNLLDYLDRTESDVIDDADIDLFCEGKLKAVTEMRQVIQNSIEDRPRHYWNMVSYIGRDGTEHRRYICPECGKDFWTDYNFCPACGADLRGAEE